MRLRASSVGAVVAATSSKIAYGFTFSFAVYRANPLALVAL